MDPVWTLFSRRTISRLAYWLSALGYDLRDRSLSNRIYLIYFCAFWAVWSIAVFALLGGAVADGFEAIPDASPPSRVVVTFAEFTLVIWAVVGLWRVSRRSPMVFSEEDAYLLCQTPVSRRKVGLIWFLQGVISTSIPFVVGTIILSFALVEWHFQGEGSAIHIFEYLKISLRALLMVLPLMIGLQGVLWGIGSIRLHKHSEASWLRFVVLAAGLFFLLSFLIPGLHRFSIAPLYLPLEAAFSLEGSVSRTLAGFGVSGLYLAVGLIYFYAQSRDVNLSLAAQETSYIATVKLARSYWQFDLADALQERRRQGTTHVESHLLVKHSHNVLFWKDLAQSIRMFRIRQLLDLTWVFGLSLLMFRPSNWAFQMVICGIWTISVGGLSTRRLRSDLARWWLLRSLPLRLNDLLRDELLLSLGLCTVASGIALMLSRLPAVLAIFAALMLPVLVANAALAGSYDILRHSKARLLMSPSLAEENVPRQEFWGVLNGLFSVLIPFGMLAWSYADPRQNLWGLIAFPVGILIARFNLNRVLSAYRGIE